MYEIYINENKLILAKSTKIDLSEFKRKDVLVAAYPGKAKFLLNYVDMMEKGNSFRRIVLHAPSKKALTADFESLFTTINAGGGLVTNETGQILFIYRRGSWDLPKGKLELNESKKQGAVREVMEETGVTNVKLKKRLITTRHTYNNKSGKRLIKKTYWYHMVVAKQKLIPQTEEDITEARWMSIKEFESKKRVVFKNIQDVIEAYKQSIA